MSGKKNAIITGGSRGIGRACALELGNMGYNVVVNYTSASSEAKAAEVVELLKAKGVDALAVRADVSKYEDCKRLVAEAVAFFGERIDALVNNAGIQVNKKFLDVEWDEIVNIINVNLLGEIASCKAALPYMVDHDDACIVNLGSMASLVAVADAVPYCASKTGVLGLSRALAAEIGHRNVRVNTICPGAIQTDMLAGAPKENLDALAATLPIQRIGEPEDIAQAMRYLIEASYVTGAVISPGGGAVLQ